MLSLSEKTSEEAARRSGNETSFGVGWGASSLRGNLPQCLSRFRRLVMGAAQTQTRGADAECERPDAGVFGAGGHTSVWSVWLERGEGGGEGGSVKTEKRLPN